MLRKIMRKWVLQIPEKARNVNKWKKIAHLNIVEVVGRKTQL